MKAKAQGGKQADGVEKEADDEGAGQRTGQWREKGE